jgi:hypothetical protein
LLDVFKDKVRFGLMTFDTHPDTGDGLDGSNAMDAEDGMEGTWSYYVPADDTPKYGRPANCSTTQPMEVGARNAAAPPWEGRMVAFGSPDAATADIETRNSYIQKVLMSTRPYGATPIAGMLKDARDFLLEDKTIDPDPIPASPAPTGAKADFGPRMDPYLECGRKQAVLLLTDGLPNMDLRPACAEATSAGVRHRTGFRLATASRIRSRDRRILRGVPRALPRRGRVFLPTRIRTGARRNALRGFLHPVRAGMPHSEAAEFQQLRCARPQIRGFS